MSKPLIQTTGRLKEAVAEASLEAVERRHILAVLQQTAWVIDGARGAAKILGLHPNTLRSRLKKLGLPLLESLPVVEDEATIEPRSASEIGQRCLAILVCAAKGETNDAKLVDELLARFEIAEQLSPHERLFIKNAQPTQQELADYSWQYEGVHVLLWALGELPELAPPNQQCDVGAMGCNFDCRPFHCLRGQRKLGR